MKTYRRQILAVAVAALLLFGLIGFSGIADAASTTLTNTPTDTPTSTATNMPTNTPTSTATNAPTNTATSTATNMPTNTATDTPTSTVTNMPTNTATSTVTNRAHQHSTHNTPTSTVTNAPTNTATSTATNAPTNTATSTATNAPTNTATSTATNAPTNTATSTATNAPTNTATSTATNTPTNTPVPFNGCTPGYWKQSQHFDSWALTGFTPNQTLESVFDVPNSFSLDNKTLLQALSFKGGAGKVGAAETLLRAAVSALLNASSPDLDYPLTSAQVISRVNAALASNNRSTMLALAKTLDEYNNLFCPLN